jgi:hypothetical protein
MNRRALFTLAALPSVAALQSKARAHSLQTDAARPAARQAAHGASMPVEVDLDDPSAAEFFRNPPTDLYVRLEELDPGDPGQLSGAVLRIMSGGKYVIFNAEIGEALQRDGSRITHCLGTLHYEELASLAAADPSDCSDSEVVPLRELYSWADRGAFSGADLILFAGEDPELQLRFGAHCLGVLRGEPLAKFLACLRMRRSALTA